MLILILIIVNHGISTTAADMIRLTVQVAEERKDFWISLTFSKLSWNPAVRQAFLPETLFEISACIVETMERRYDLETFERLNNDGTTTPEFVTEISGVSRQCSHKGMIEQQRRLMKQQMEQPNIKDMM